MSLYTRTGSNGTFPDFFIRDLGVTILTGASWYPLESLDGYGYHIGQFTQEELRDSEDLTAAVRDGYLEASLDGVTAIADPESYSPLTAFFEHIRNSRGTIDLTTGTLILPETLPANPLPGQLAYSQDDGYLVVGNGATWESITPGPSLQLTVQAFNGIVNEPGQVVMTPDGIEIKALLPLIGDDVGWLFNDDGILLAIG